MIWYKNTWSPVAVIWNIPKCAKPKHSECFIGAILWKSNNSWSLNTNFCKIHIPGMRFLNWLQNARLMASQNFDSFSGLTTWTRKTPKNTKVCNSHFYASRVWFWRAEVKYMSFIFNSNLLLLICQVPLASYTYRKKGLEVLATAIYFCFVYRHRPYANFASSEIFSFEERRWSLP